MKPSTLGGYLRSSSAGTCAFGQPPSRRFNGKGLTPSYPVGIVTVVTGTELRAIRGTKTQVAFAALLGVHANTLARYERDELRIPKPVARLAKLVSTTQPKQGR